jgi:hypothetical protein
LSDKELAAEYEAGAINLPKVLKESLNKYERIKRIVSDRAKKKSDK